MRDDLPESLRALAWMAVAVICVICGLLLVGCGGTVGPDEPMVDAPTCDAAKVGCPKAEG